MNEMEQKFLTHSAKGVAWPSHKYLYIDENGRYIYPSDVKNGGGAKYGSREYEEMKSRYGKTVNTRGAINKTKNTTTKSLNTNSTTNKSTSSSVDKTNKTAASISDKKYSEEEVDKRIKEAIDAYDADRKKKEEEKKTTKKNSSTKKKASTKASSEAQSLDLTEEDVKAITSNINTEATQRDEVINSLALKVIRGDFGNGQERKDKLGQYYSVIQQRVNELIKTMGKGTKSASKKKTSTNKSTTSNAKKTVKYGDDSYYKQTGKSGTTVANRKTIKHSDEEFLMHFGTKKHSGRYEYGSGDRPYQHDPAARKKYKDATYKERRRMSDEELKERIERARLEGELKKLESDNMSRGKKFVQDVLFDIGKKTLTTAGTGLLLYAGKSFVTGEFDKKELGDSVFNGGPKKK